MSGTGKVDEYMHMLDHPLKAEMQAVRETIMNANSTIAERVKKWNAPSFFYRADLAAFDPRSRDRLHLVMLLPNGLVDDPTGLLEGDHDKQEDVRAKQAALEHMVNAWAEPEENKR